MDKNDFYEKKKHLSPSNNPTLLGGFSFECYSVICILLIMLCLLSAVPFQLCLPIAQMFIMYKYVATLLQYSVSYFNLPIFSLFFSIFPSFSPSLFFYLSSLR